MNGAARVRFAAPGKVADLYQRAPCRFLFPDVPPGEPVQGIALTTSGGLAGGDLMRIAVRVDDGACASVATQAAEKFYRALPSDSDTVVETAIDVGEDGVFEWLGQEAILFDRSRVIRRIRIDMARGARVLAAESLVFGRTAMGEHYLSGLIHDSWRILREGRLIWADALHLAGDVAAQMARPFGFGKALSLATIVYAGPDAARHLEAARELVGGDRGGATAFDHLLVVRLLGADAATMRQAVMRIVAGLRAAALGLGEHVPVVWRC